MSYTELYKQGKLEEMRDALLAKLSDCRLCPRNCGVNRLEGELGFCKSGRKLKVSSHFLHFGEEPELVGKGGSGTIFFSNCNLQCLYCQNYSISCLGQGKEVQAQELAQMMLSLQNEGAENINFVTPTHVIAQILEALVIAVQKGLNLPLVYNCGGYESVETLKIVNGIFDIYMPDIKYSNKESAKKFSHALDYWEVVKEAVSQMHRQAGDLVIEGGVAKQGLLIRHLVLPNQLAGSFEILDFIRNEISADTHVNIMQQYYPCYRASEFQELSRRITFNEYKEVVEYARKRGLK
jgi:putative pyruvate formate lyase activating enzyme